LNYCAALIAIPKPKAVNNMIMTLSTGCKNQVKGKLAVHTTKGKTSAVFAVLYFCLLSSIETALAVPPLLAAMGYEPTTGGWKLRADAPNFY
jgi:hypothetical protein